MSATFKHILNSGTRTLSGMFPSLLGATSGARHRSDYGYPQHLGYAQFKAMYERNSLASSAIDQLVDTCWEDEPNVLADQQATEESQIEKLTREHFAKLRLWERLAEADTHSLVGRYGALILRVADGLKLSEPLGRAQGLDELVEVIACDEDQLTVSEWGTDERDTDTFGKPKMFQFTETKVGTGQGPGRAVQVHPSRVVVWSRTGRVDGQSALKPGYDDLLDCEKVKGAGGVGFLKNARAALNMQIAPDVALAAMAEQMGVEASELSDKFNDVVRDFNEGLDKALVTQGMDVNTMQIQLPSPEHFFGIPLMCFAASMKIPVKILVGSQTGERASTEDAREWRKTCQSRRRRYVIPNIMSFMDRLREVGILNADLMELAWSDLTEMTKEQKIDRADKMATINQKQGLDEPVFSRGEIRATVDMPPEPELVDEDSDEDDIEDGDDP